MSMDVRWRALAWPVLALACLVGGRASGAAQSGQEPSWRVLSVGRSQYQLWRRGELLLTFNQHVAGHKGLRPDMSAMPEAKDGARMFHDRFGFLPPRGRQLELKERKLQFDYAYTARRADPRTLSVTTRTATRETTLADGCWVWVPVDGWLNGGRCVVTEKGGATRSLELPTKRGPVSEQAVSLEFQAPDGGRFTIVPSGPVPVDSDIGNILVYFWKGFIRQGHPWETTLSFQFDGRLEFEPANQIVEMGEWFLYETSQDFSPGSATGMEDWLDAPAGKHGFLQMDGGRFVFEDGTPVKFWGINIGFSHMAVPPDQAEKWAQKLAKHGANIVRMHKFTGHKRWNGLMSDENPFDFNEEQARLMDNIHAELGRRGIYVSWSPIFAIQFHEAFRDRMLAYDELKNASAEMGGMFANALYPASTFAPGVQDIYIDIVTAWLNRVNTVTGRRYADDPALAYVEMRNEADVFFGVSRLLGACPTYKKLVRDKYSAWLREKYGTDEALRVAWGDQLGDGESLSTGGFYPFHYTRDPIRATPRAADGYHFLYDYQTEFYRRFARAIRATGYRGALVGSCWRGGDTYGELYNIASDREVGLIDRHNYFGQGMPMIGRPGSSILGAGVRQVADRPFALSEWAGSHVFGAESPPTVGFIGLGLQGWDASMQFASAWWGINTNGRGSCDAFDSIGQYPFIARTLYSGNLREAPPVLTRRVSVQELHAGRFGPDEASGVSTERTAAFYGDDVPEAVLAAGKLSLEYVDEPVEPRVVKEDLSRYIDHEKGIIRAAGGQVVWDYGGRGFYSVDTASTQAVIGFGGGRKHELTDCTISYENPFANVYVVAREPGAALADARQILIMTIARTAAEGSLLEETVIRPLSVPQREPIPGNRHDLFVKRQLEEPVLRLEPVQAGVAIKRGGSCRVYPLDHDGRRRGHSSLVPGGDVVPVQRVGDEWRIGLDGRRFLTPYYLVEFEG
jgi:hypothetical protein